MFASNKEPRSRTETTPDASGSKSSEAAPARSGEARHAAPSIISPDLKIVGNLQSRGDIQIDGTIEGDIDCQSLTVGESAQVSGTIESKLVRICGAVDGEVRGENIVLAKTARVKGDIVHSSLEIEAGAEFEGAVRRMDAAASAKTSNGKVESPKPAAVDAKSDKTDAKSQKNGSAAVADAVQAKGAKDGQAASL